MRIGTAYVSPENINHPTTLELREIGYEIEPDPRMPLGIVWVNEPRLIRHFDLNRNSMMVSHKTNEVISLEEKMENLRERSRKN